MKLNQHSVSNPQHKPFNWTKVELKPKKTDAATDALKTFNWTKVELKPDILAYDIILGGTFNWTKVELKLCWPRT